MLWSNAVSTIYIVTLTSPWSLQVLVKIYFHRTECNRLKINLNFKLVNYLEVKRK